MTTQPGSTPELERQRTRIEAAFREGWRPMGAGEPRALTEGHYAEARRILDHGGWTGLDPATIQAVRGGAQPGDPLPPLQPHPFIDNVTGAEVTITGAGPAQRVAVLFSHQRFPGIRFGHRFPYPPAGDHGLAAIDLKEEVDTGALDRMMADPPAADDAGIIWTRWGDQNPGTGLPGA